MPILTGWYEVGQVYYMQASGTVALGSVVSAVLRLKQAVSPYPSTAIHTVADVRQLQGYELPLRELVKALAPIRELEPHGWAVLIGDATPLLKFSLKAASHLYQFPLIIFDEVEDGLAYLNQLDRTLPDLMPLHEVSWTLPGEHDIL